MKKANPWTGTVHHKDGKREFVEGGEVGGVNNWVRSGSLAQHKSDPIVGSDGEFDPSTYPSHEPCA